MTKKIIRLNESQFEKLVEKILKEYEQFDDTPFEDEEDLEDNEDEEDEMDDYGFDYEDDVEDEEDFQNKMRNRERIRSHRQGSMGIGSDKRWDKDSEKPFSPLKSDDLPLEKFLKSKYNRAKK